MSDTPLDLGNVFGAAGLSSTSVDALTSPDVGAAIADALGGDASLGSEDDEAVLLALVVDDSFSISWIDRGPEAMVDFYNYVVKSLTSSADRDLFQVYTNLLNGGQLSPYAFIQDAPTMALGGNYKAEGVTPLHDTVLTVAGSIAAKRAVLEAEGTTVRALIFVISDGADQGSRHTATEVHEVVTDMSQDPTNVFIGIGINNPRTPVDFREVYLGLGFNGELIRDIDADEGTIRQLGGTVSRISQRVSQGADASMLANAGAFTTT